MKAFKSNWFKIIIVILVNLVFFIAWKVSFDVAEKTANRAGYYIPLFNVPSSYISVNQDKIDVLEYKINIELMPKSQMIEGDVTITGLLLDKKMRQIDLNFYDNFQITRLTLNDEDAQYDIEDMHLTIPFENIKGDTFRVRIVYSGQPEKKGLASFSFDQFKNRQVIYSLNEPIFASTWFPCNDKPDDKAQLDISITNDSSKVSVSNGRLVNVSTEGDRRTYHWKTIYPLSTYLICLYSADYKHFNDVYISGKDTMNIDYFVFPEHFEMAQVDFNEHLKYMEYFKSIFGEYPFIKEKYGVAEFLWQMGAMEHQTITGIGSNFLNGKGMFSEFYIHELAHQWLGDAVGPSSWKDIWLNEGFASYCEALYSEHKYGFSSYKAVMQQKFQTEFKGTVYDPDYLFSSTVYDKGAWVVHMLRWELGDSTFFKVLHDYYNTYKYKNASTNDLLKICNKVSGRDLTQFFKQWVYEGTGILTVNYRIEKNDNDDTFYIVLKQTQDGYTDYRFPLEVQLKNKNGQETYRNIFYIDKPEKTIKIKADSNDQVVLDPDNWLLAEFTEKQK